MRIPKGQSGGIWADYHKTRPFEEKVRNGIKYFQEKWGETEIEVVYFYKSQDVKYPEHVDGVPVIPTPMMLPYNFLICPKNPIPRVVRYSKDNS